MVLNLINEELINILLSNIHIRNKVYVLVKILKNIVLIIVLISMKLIEK